MGSKINYLDRPIREIPQIIMNGAKDGFTKAIDWTYQLTLRTQGVFWAV